MWKKKSMYGKSFMGLARTTFLIGADGVVARRWDNVKVDGHADAVLEAVEALSPAPAREALTAPFEWIVPGVSC